MEAKAGAWVAGGRRPLLQAEKLWAFPDQAAHPARGEPWSSFGFGPRPHPIKAIVTLR